MWIAIRNRWVKTYEFEQFTDACSTVFFGHSEVFLKRFGDCLMHRHSWVERAVGILEDDLQTLANQL